MGSSLLESVVEQFSQSIKKTQSQIHQLASIEELAQFYNVSKPTMLRAARVLRERGLITFGRGQALKISSSSLASQQIKNPKQILSEVDRITQDIEQGILNNLFATGEPLPKMDYFVNFYKVSNKTIQKVYQSLIRKNLLSKLGNRFYVGKAKRPEAKIIIENDCPVILIITIQYSLINLTYKQSLFQSQDMINRFKNTFDSECRKFHIRQHICELDASEFQYNIGKGIQKVQEIIKSLGSKYIGSLFLHSPGWSGKMENLVKTLLLAKKKVIWFDRVHKQIDIPFSHPLFSKCLINEKQAAHLAISFIHSFGSQRIGYLAQKPYVQLWGSHRLDSLNSEVNQSIHLQQVESGGQRNFWKKLIQAPITNLPNLIQDYPTYLQPLLKKLIKANQFHYSATEFRKGQHSLQKLLPKYSTEEHSLLYVFPFFHSLLKKEITCIIGLTDFWSYYCYQLLKWIQPTHSQKISLLSYGNSPLIQSMPISSIDINVDTLGFKAFHYLRDDIPVKRSKKGDITTDCVLIDRGSVFKKP